MRILVCIKQVQDSESPIEFSPDTGWFGDSGSTAYRINSYDEYALEEAVCIREKFDGVSVDALSVGPARVREVLKKALEKGADNAVHILCNESGYLSPSRVSDMIARYAENEGYDIIFSGVMSEDLMQFQTGPMIAGKMKLPCVNSVIRTELNIKERTLYTESEVEGGNRDICTVKLPAVLTIQSGINSPRYPSLSNVLRAKNQEPLQIEAFSKQDFIDENSVSLFFAEKSSNCEFLEGSTLEKADKLLSILHKNSLL